MVDTVDRGEGSVGAWDHYELAEPYPCPWCGVEVTGQWRGFDGPKALLLWRQGLEIPKGRLWPDAPLGIDRSLFDQSHLPGTFRIKAHCPDGHAVALIGKAPNGVWTTVSSTVEQSRMLETYAAQLPWTKWEALEQWWPGHGAVTAIAASIESNGGEPFVRYAGTNATTGLSIAVSVINDRIQFDDGPAWTIVATDDPVVAEVQDEGGRLVMTSRRVEKPTYAGNEELGYRFDGINDATTITVGAMTADLWRDDPWLPLAEMDPEAPLVEAFAGFNFIPDPFDRKWAYALIGAGATSTRRGQPQESTVDIGISETAPFVATVLASHVAIADARIEVTRRRDVPPGPLS